MQSTKHSRPTVGVLAGAQVYYGTILGTNLHAFFAVQNLGARF